MNNIRYLNVEYIDSAEFITYNGKDCNFKDNIFPYSKKTESTDYDALINFTIDIDTGKVLNWKEGDTACIYNKPVDSGIYTFMDENKKNVLKISDYVIDGLDIEDEGFGDYIILRILPDGTINNWNKDKVLKAYNKYKEA